MKCKFGNVSIYLVFKKGHKIQACRGVSRLHVQVKIKKQNKIDEKAGKFQPFSVLVSQSIWFL
jgi:hypothetical protein